MSKYKRYSPIVIFSYNRLENLRCLIDSLLKNPECKYSKLYIFQDFYKNKIEKKKFIQIIFYLESIKGFKKKIIFLRKKNLGLKNNIIYGINKFFSLEKQGIFLEDDLVVSKNFLRFMNKCLFFYKRTKRVWSISGWNYNFSFKDKYDAILIRYSSSWGWGTWADRWKNFKINPKYIINKWDQNKIFRFNLGNTYDYFSQIVRNYNGILNTWAIFWYATIFEKDGLCVCPKNSLVVNNGFNYKATNTKKINKLHLTKLQQMNKNFSLPSIIVENEKFIKKLINFIKKNKNSYNNKTLYFLSMIKNNIYIFLKNFNFFK
jgi:hypothetical protein